MVIDYKSLNDWTLNTQLGCFMNTTLVSLNRGIRHSPAMLSHLLRPRQKLNSVHLSKRRDRLQRLEGAGTCCFSRRKQQVPRSFVIPVTENLICTLTVTSGNESVNKQNQALPDYNTAIRVPDVRLNVTHYL